ncbi:MAG: glycerol kinase GlpK [Clostridia bacterium]|nr:glycerol kinase GlpK [Clostridia bacterium]
MEKKYLLALDEGTTSARAILFDENLNIASISQHEFAQIYPRPGWVEQDPLAIYAAQLSAMTECIAQSGISPKAIVGIGLTNQRETCVVWDRNTGKPVYHAIVWQCRRTADYCEQLKKDGHADMILKKTGLKIDAYFSASKIKWIMDQVPGVRERAERGELICGTIDTFLIWKLTDGKLFITDQTNASRTMLYNIRTGEWDDELLALFGIPKGMLPEVHSSSEYYGEIRFMGAKIPLCGIAGDQQAALFGQGCFEKGMAKNTYGTGCFLLAHTGQEPVLSKNGLLTTVCATEKGKPLEYALEGSVFVGGAVVQWLRDELHFITDSQDSEYFAKKVKSCGGVYVVPSFVGMGAPFWNMNVRGAVFGLTRGSGKDQIIRAALESIAYQSDDMLKAMQADFGGEISSLKVDGGASANSFLMQFQSSISNIHVSRPQNREATAAGVAALAGLAGGVFENRSEILDLLGAGDDFDPQMNDDTRKKLIDGWHRAVKACMAFQCNE